MQAGYPARENVRQTQPLVRHEDISNMLQITHDIIYLPSGVRLTIIIDQVADGRHQLLWVEQHVPLKVAVQKRLVGSGSSVGVREALASWVLGINEGGRVESLGKIVHGYVPENLVVGDK
jgi:hypothetical protein